jgi:acetoacetate decarboxylase
MTGDVRCSAIASVSTSEEWILEEVIAMQYVRTASELARWRRTGAFPVRFTGAEMVVVLARTDPKVVAAVLPKPLRVPKEPVVSAFVARYPQTNFGVDYSEGARFVGAEYRGEQGLYCLAMPVDDDTAMIGGREQFGFPKKIADHISLERDGSRVVGSVVRHGVEILHIEGDAHQDVTPEPMWGTRQVLNLEGRPAEASTSFLFKYSMAAGGGMFAHLPQLVRQVTLLAAREGTLEGVEGAKLELVSSKVDALGEIPAYEILGATYGVFDNTMLPGKVLRRVYNPLAFAPYAMFKNDILTYIDPNTLPVRTGAERRRQRRELAKY